MPIILSEHARVQIKRRKITKRLVETIIRNPDRIFASFRGRKLRQASVGDKILEVVTRTEGSRITVITAYYLEE